MRPEQVDKANDAVLQNLNVKQTKFLLRKKKQQTMIYSFIQLLEEKTWSKKIHRADEEDEEGKKQLQHHFREKLRCRGNQI